MSATDALDAYLAHATNPSLPPAAQPTPRATSRETAQADEYVGPRNHALPKPWTSQRTDTASPRGVDTSSSAAIQATKWSEVRGSAPARATTGRAVSAKPGTSKPQQGRAATLKLASSKPRAPPLPRVAMLGKLGPEPRPSVRTSGSTSSKAKPSGISVAGAWPPPAGSTSQGRTLGEKCDQQGAATLAGPAHSCGTPAVGLLEEGRGVRASNKTGHLLSPTTNSTASQNPLTIEQGISTSGHGPQGNMPGSPGPAAAVRYAISTGLQLQTSPTAVSRRDLAEPQELLSRSPLQVQGPPLVDFAAEPDEVAQNLLEGFALGGPADEGCAHEPHDAALADGGRNPTSSPLSHVLRHKPMPHQHAEAAGELANPFLWVSPARAEWKPSGDDNAATSHQVHRSRQQVPSKGRDLDGAELTEWDPLAILRGRGFGVGDPSGVCRTIGWPQAGLGGRANPAASAAGGNGLCQVPKEGLRGRANPAASAAGGDGLRQVAEGLLSERPRLEPYGDVHSESAEQIGSQGLALGGGGFSALDHSIALGLSGGSQWMALQPEEWLRAPRGGTGAKRARKEAARGAHVTADWATLASMPDAPTLHREPSWAASAGPPSPAVPIFDLNHPQIPTPPRLHPQLYGPRASAGPPGGLFSDEGPPRLAERRHACGGPPRVPRSPCGREATGGHRLDVGEAAPLSDVSRQLQDLRLQWHTFCDAHLNCTPHHIYTPHLTHNPCHIPSHAPSRTTPPNIKPQPARLPSPSQHHGTATACASHAQNPASPPPAPNPPSKSPRPMMRRALGFRMAPIRVRPSRATAVPLPAAKPHPATGHDPGTNSSEKCTCSIASSGVRTPDPHAPNRRMGATAGPSIGMAKVNTRRRLMRPSVQGRGRAVTTPPPKTEAVTRGRARALAVAPLAERVTSEQYLPAAQTAGNRAKDRHAPADGRTSSRKVMEHARSGAQAGPVGDRGGCERSCNNASSRRQQNAPVTRDVFLNPGERAAVQGSGVKSRVRPAREVGRCQRLRSRPCPVLQRVGQTLSPGYRPLRKGHILGGKPPLLQVRRGVPPLGDCRRREKFPCSLSDESSGSSGQEEGEDSSQTSTSGSETERSSLTDDTSTSVAAAAHQAAHHRHLSRQNLGRTRYSLHRVPSLSWCASSRQHSTVHQSGFRHAKHAPPQSPVHRLTRQSCGAFAHAPASQTPVAWGTPGRSASHGSQLPQGHWQVREGVAQKPARMCDKRGALPRSRGREPSPAWALDLEGVGQCPVEPAERAGHPWDGTDGATCHIMPEEGQPAPLRGSSAEAGLGSDMGSEGNVEACENGTGELAPDFLHERKSPVLRGCSRAEAGRGSDESSRRPGEGCEQTGKPPLCDARERGFAVAWGSAVAEAGGESDWRERVFAAAWGSNSARDEAESDGLACASAEAEGSDQHPPPGIGAGLAGPWLTCGDASTMFTSDLCKSQADAVSCEGGRSNGKPACTLDPGNLCEEASHSRVNCGDGSSACLVKSQDLTAQRTHPRLAYDDDNTPRPLLAQDMPASHQSPVPKKHRAMPCPLQGAESALFGAAAIRARYPALFAQSGVEALIDGSPGTHVAAGQGCCAVASEDGPQPLLWGKLYSISVGTGEDSHAGRSGIDSGPVLGDTAQGPRVGSGGVWPEVGGGTGLQSFGLTTGSADPTRVDTCVLPLEIIGTDVGSGGDLGDVGLVGASTKGQTPSGSLQTSLFDGVSNDEGSHGAHAGSGERSLAGQCEASLSSHVLAPPVVVEPSPEMHLADGSRAPALGLPACRARAC